MKVLRPVDARPDWRAIEVRRDPGGWCEISLSAGRGHGPEAEIGSLSVSMSHEGGIANAVVVAMMLEARRARCRSKRCRRRTTVMQDRVREVVAEHGRLAVDVGTLSDDDDLYRAGLTSHASVNLMLALEDAFDVEFPDHLLRRQTFESVASICEGLAELVPSNA